MKTYWKKGSWDATCDVCGFRFKADQLKKRWDGLMTCAADWEPRHPQDYLRAVPDKQAVPWTRPDNDGPYIGPNWAVDYFDEGYLESFAWPNGVYLNDNWIDNFNNIYYASGGYWNPDYTGSIG